MGTTVKVENNLKPNLKGEKHVYLANVTGQPGMRFGMEP